MKKLSAKKVEKFYRDLQDNLMMQNPKLTTRKPLDKSLEKMSKELWKKYKNYPKV